MAIAKANSFDITTPKTYDALSEEVSPGSRAGVRHFRAVTFHTAFPALDRGGELSRGHLQPRELSRRTGRQPPAENRASQSQDSRKPPRAPGGRPGPPGNGRAQRLGRIARLAESRRTRLPFLGTCPWLGHEHSHRRAQPVSHGRATTADEPIVPSLRPPLPGEPGFCRSGYPGRPAL